VSRWTPYALALSLALSLVGCEQEKPTRADPPTPPSSDTPNSPAEPQPAEPGRAAIHRALDRLYPAEKDYRFGLSANDGELEPPLAEIVVYRASRPMPHWHYITYGLSELGEKTSEDTGLSGFGVEYSLRLVDGSEEPPVWPLNLLRYLATLVRETREPMDPKHSMDLPKGLLEEVSPGVEGLGFVKDADLGTIETPNGKVTFVNVLPLAAREWWLLGAWDFDKYLDEVREQQGDLLWRTTRGSVLEGERGKAIEARVRKEGSSQAVDFCEVRWGDEGFVLDDASRSVLVKLLRYRLAFDRDAKIIAGVREVQLSPGKSWKTTCTGSRCELQVPAGEAAAFAQVLEDAKDGAVLEKPGNTTFRVTAGLLPVEDPGTRRAPAQ
jgi:hypothetical protein